MQLQSLVLDSICYVLITLEFYISLIPDFNDPDIQMSNVMTTLSLRCGHMVSTVVVAVDKKYKKRLHTFYLREKLDKQLSQTYHCISLGMLTYKL